MQLRTITVHDPLCPQKYTAAINLLCSCLPEPAITPKEHYLNKRAFGNLPNDKGASQAEKGDPEEIHHPEGCRKPVLCYTRPKASSAFPSRAGLEIRVGRAGQARALRLAVPVLLVLYRSGLLGGSNPEDGFGCHLGQAGGWC